MIDNIKYQSGFGNHFASEAIENALPKGQNTPQKAPYGLYAEQINGTAFTAPRSANQRSWFYRIRPSVIHGEFKQIDNGKWETVPFDKIPSPPNQMRWNPIPIPETKTDFIDGICTIGGNGSVDTQNGCAAHLYVANASMTDRFFYNSDGHMLLVPQHGKLIINTEYGPIDLSPGEICVVPRGIKFQVLLLEESARGYICENYGSAFVLPYLGAVGANGYANPRDFLFPVANYEQRSGNFKLTNKFLGNLWQADLSHSPMDVVAWHGNYAPYKYDLSLFQAINSVNFDHPDPSIFTVLTVPSSEEGVANLDFVIFPPRWLVAEKTFRPPYFHRNVMSEFMGLIYGVYDGKTDAFAPGGSSLHNRMSAHGPDAETYEKAVAAELKPVFLQGTLAFMFESCLPYRLSQFANSTEHRQSKYQQCWQGLQVHFDPENIAPQGE